MKFIELTAYDDKDPVVINFDLVRSFYPVRRLEFEDGKEYSTIATRIVFNSEAAYDVSQSVDYIMRCLNGEFDEE